jgi:phosphorylcholine metabolism protein LicD
MITSKQFGQMTEEEKDQITDLLYNFCLNLEEKFNVETFLCGGTFLGAYRDKDYITHDDDIDINYFCKNCSNIIGVKKLSMSIAKYFKEQKLLKRKISSTHHHIWMREDHFFYVDIFPCWIDKNKDFISAGPSNRIYSGCGSSNNVFPLSSISFRNHTFKIPNNPEHFATWMWGTDWKIPKKLSHGYWPEGIGTKRYYA